MLSPQFSVILGWLLECELLPAAFQIQRHQNVTHDPSDKRRKGCWIQLKKGFSNPISFNALSIMKSGINRTN